MEVLFESYPQSELLPNIKSRFVTPRDAFAKNSGEYNEGSPFIRIQDKDVDGG
jgi:hypothetical protein